MERRAEYQVEPDFAARQSILWAIAWLVGAITLVTLVHVLLARPQLFGDLGFVAYGRLRPIADNAVVFGWLGTVVFAAIFALIPRVTEVQLHNEPLGAATTLAWALVLTGGEVGVLLGLNQGRPLAEFPAGADLGIVLLLVMVLYNAAVTVIRRRERTLYVSGWFLLAAALLGPLIFVLGNLPVFSGVTDAILSGFYLNGLEMLWLLPVALGIAHYVVPVETGNALYSSALARTAFWSLMFAGGWTGQRFFMKGPAPDYLDTIAVAMTAVLLIPALSSAVNLFSTGGERWHLLTQAYGLRWAATGLALLVAWTALILVTTIPSVSRYVGVTTWQSGVRYLALLGVFSSFAFAFIYHAYPLMVGRDWYSRSLASFHYWATTIGVIAAVALMLATGAAQGALLNQGVGGAYADEQLAAAATGGVIGLLRMLTAAALGLVMVAQYALALNTLRTSRSGPFLHVDTRAAMLEGAR